VLDVLTYVVVMGSVMLDVRVCGGGGGVPCLMCVPGCYALCVRACAILDVRVCHVCVWRRWWWGVCVGGGVCVCLICV